MLKLSLLSGGRKGESIFLPDVNQSLQGVIPWVLEDDAIEFRLKAPSNYKSATLEVYQHSIMAVVDDSLEENGMTEFVWNPKVGSYQVEKLFLNYFGISELTVLLFNENEELVELVKFQPLQVAAKKSSADHVEEMFGYLAGISSEALHSVFSATRHSVGFEEGNMSPSHTLERIQHSVELLREFLPLIFSKPITRLVPEHKLLPTTGSEELDDASIGWLLENLSVLEPDENPDQAHIYYEGQHYHASTMRVSVLNENSDVYENRVIHGFVELLLREAQQLGQRYGYELQSHNQFADLPKGYVSFFEKISRFKSQLVGAQINRIDRIIEPLKYIKTMLENRLPVTRTSSDRPIFTPKVRSSHAYRDVFVEIIKWHEKGAVDWSAYENLFAIKSIPVLFESYCYFRVVESVNRFFNPAVISGVATPQLDLKFVDLSGCEILVEREPNYWTALHKSKHDKGIVNSEGYTVKDQYSYYPRGQTGPNSRRQPDIVIQIKRPNSGATQLIVMDAKYTKSNTAFIRYLPELTMKYVHGIHRPGQDVKTVTSLSILYPDNINHSFSSFHHGDMGLFGDYPVEPNLQTIGLILGEQREHDMLAKLVEKLLDINGVRRSQLSFIQQENVA